MAEIYVSTDVEADGPIPGPHSMLGFASAAFLADKTLVGTFEANLSARSLPRTRPATRGRWRGGRRSQEAWAACRKDPGDPQEVMPRYVRWLEGASGTPGFCRLSGGL